MFVRRFDPQGRRFRNFYLLLLLRTVLHKQHKHAAWCSKHGASASHGRDPQTSGQDPAARVRMTRIVHALTACKNKSDYAVQQKAQYPINAPNHGQRGHLFGAHTHHLRERARDREMATEKERENSKTLFYKDCSLGSVKNLSNVFRDK